ncbi:hypothetical protein QN224_32015 [Sinorhizobium sp. 8-89]|nr:hypothetical protein [Sinorhizobium sp. 7-81]MDK1389951.1 hypothetical protein [Sinorhizobium sp. 7-81]
MGVFAPPPLSRTAPDMQALSASGRIGPIFHVPERAQGGAFLPCLAW